MIKKDWYQLLQVHRKASPAVIEAAFKALMKEQTGYSGFAVSYAKDMAVAGRIQVGELSQYAWILFELLVEMDKTLES